MLATFVLWFVAFGAYRMGSFSVLLGMNAFCNVNRCEILLLFRDFPGLDVGEWIDWFFSSLQIYVQTPYGLTDPYTPRQGGTQGDSMGVGCYMPVRVMRYKALKSMINGLY